MKFVLAATALITIAALSPAQAFQAQTIERVATPEIFDVRERTADYHHYHDRCLHQSAGTSHHSCGTRTGGPAGGHH